MVGSLNGFRCQFCFAPLPDISLLPGTGHPKGGIRITGVHPLRDVAAASGEFAFAAIRVGPQRPHRRFPAGVLDSRTVARTRWGVRARWQIRPATQICMEVEKIPGSIRSVSSRFDRAMSGLDLLDAGRKARLGNPLSHPRLRRSFQRRLSDRRGRIPFDPSMKTKESGRNGATSFHVPFLLRFDQPVHR
jgi:hypothetical protein